MALYLKQFRITCIREHHFSPSLTSDSIVVDLGSHLGQFAIAVASRYGAKVYAVEPCKDLLDRIPDHPLVRKLNYAITGSDELVAMNRSTNPEANSTRAISPLVGKYLSTESVPAVRFESLLELLGIEAVDLLKVDIEGSEIEMFASTSDETLVAVKQITIEFHDFIVDMGLLAEVEEILKRLRRLGFATAVFSPGSRQDVLCVNKRYLRFPVVTGFYLAHLRAAAEVALSEAVRVTKNAVKRVLSPLLPISRSAAPRG